MNEDGTAKKWFRDGQPSGQYRPYIEDEWELSADGGWEQVLKELHAACEAWIRQPHNLGGQNGKKTLLIPPGAVWRSPRRAGAGAGAGAGAAAAVYAPPASCLAHIDVIQARSEGAQNCVLGSIANCINVEAKDGALAGSMQSEINATESKRTKLNKCGAHVISLSKGAFKSRKASSFLAGSVVQPRDVNLAFFQSDDPAAFGSFVIRVTDPDDGKEHAIALIRHDRHDPSKNYVLDSNPKFGPFAHPFTTAALRTIDVVDINFAMKIELDRSKR